MGNTALESQLRVILGDKDQTTILMDILDATNELYEYARTLRFSQAAARVVVKKDKTTSGAIDNYGKELYQKTLFSKWGGIYRSEEEEQALGTKNGFEWLVDENDGTTNINAGAVEGGFGSIPFSCTSVCLLQDSEKGEPQRFISVVRNICSGEAYFAVKDKGAFVTLEMQGTHHIKQLYCNNNPIDKVCNGRPILALGHLDPEVAKYTLAKETKITGRVKSAFEEAAAQINMRPTDRKFGSIALELCMVASGSVTTYITKAYPWDCMAGIHIAEESGAKVKVSMRKKEGSERDRAAIIASHPDFYDQVLRAFNRDLSFSQRVTLPARIGPEEPGVDQPSI